MKILAIGDSFTYGEELSDLNQAWPYVLASKLNGTAINLGEPASSNDKILRKCVEWIVKNKEPVDLIIIAWASPGRTEYADDHGRYDLWPGYSGELFLKDNMLWRKDLADYINKYHNIDAYYEKYLQQVILLQSFLSIKKQKYIMVSVTERDYYKRVKDPAAYSSYNDQIDKITYFGYKKEGFLEWAQSAKKGKFGHFLEEGHQIVTDKIYEHIRNIGWVS